jgi:hypothetical protein
VRLTIKDEGPKSSGRFTAIKILSLVIDEQGWSRTHCLEFVLLFRGKPEDFLEFWKPSKHFVKELQIENELSKACWHMITVPCGTAVCMTLPFQNCILFTF